jgi:hypothetical protein
MIIVFRKKNKRGLCVELGVPQPLDIPIQMFTHPSAPAMQAPSQESSVSGGHTTPWTSAYACRFPVSGNNNGNVLVRKRETVCGRSISGISGVRQAVELVLTSVEQWGCELLKHRTIWQVYSHWDAAYARGTILVRSGRCSPRIHRWRTGVQRTRSRWGRLGACGYSCWCDL